MPVGTGLAAGLGSEHVVGFSTGGSRPRLPTTNRAKLSLVESLAFDRKEKAALFAKAGIPEYWIVDLTGRKLEVYRDHGPVPDKPDTFAYASRQLFEPDQSVQPLRVPGPPCPLNRFFDSSP